MYQPYPQDTQMPEARHLPAPASMLNAARNSTEFFKATPA